MRSIWGAVICGLTLWLGTGVALATDPQFMGRWSIDPAGCSAFGQTAKTSPLVVGERSVDWFRTRCSIKKSYRIGNGLYLEAQCLSDGSSRKMPIGLQLNGTRLRVFWDKTMAGDMQRCR